MDAPDDLEAFKESFKQHFRKYPRSSARIVTVGREYFSRPVTDSKVLEEQFKIHETPMDLEEVQKFVGRFCDRAILPDDTRIIFSYSSTKVKSKQDIHSRTKRTLIDGRNEQFAYTVLILR